MAHTFEFALVRLTPDLAREESVNIGVIVFHSDNVDVRISADSKLLSHWALDSDSVDWLAQAIRDADQPKLTSMERARIFCHDFNLVIGKIGWLTANTMDEYERNVSSLLRRYVDPIKKRPSPRKKTTNLHRRLKKIFQSYEILGQPDDRLDSHKIIPAMPVGADGHLNLDFGLKNGSFHATETLNFAHSDNTGSSELKSAALAAVTLQHARLSFGPKTKCYLLYSANPSYEKALTPAIGLASEGVESVFNAEDKNDLSRYVDIMVKASRDRML